MFDFLQEIQKIPTLSSVGDFSLPVPEGGINENTPILCRKCAAEFVERIDQLAEKNPTRVNTCKQVMAPPKFLAVFLGSCRSASRQRSAKRDDWPPGREKRGGPVGFLRLPEGL